MLGEQWCFPGESAQFVRGDVVSWWDGRPLEMKKLKSPQGRGCIGGIAWFLEGG